MNIVTKSHFLARLRSDNHNVMLFALLQNLWYTQNRRGYITLISVLVVGAVTTVIATSLLFFGITSSRTIVLLERSLAAETLTIACAEEALQQIRDSTPFIGSGTLTFGPGSCSYLVTSQGGQNRTIMSSSTIDTTARKVRMIIDKITPNIQVVSWQNVADF